MTPTTPHAAHNETILTQSQARKIIVESLFKPDAHGTLGAVKKTRLDRGKYQASVIGKPVAPHIRGSVRLAWAERRKDAYGPYYALYCVPAQDRTRERHETR